MLTQFHYTDWNDGRQQPSAASILQLNNFILNLQKSTGNKPMIIMCRYVRMYSYYLKSAYVYLRRWTILRDLIYLILVSHFFLHIAMVVVALVHFWASTPRLIDLKLKQWLMSSSVWKQQEFNAWILLAQWCVCNKPGHLNLIRHLRSYTHTSWINLFGALHVSFKG